LARNVQDEARRAGVKPMGVEGETEGDRVLVDLRDVVVHVMRPQLRDFYNLEKLWSVAPEAQQIPPARVASRERR
ncbi:MAG TPA: ribosome silencing factor, partial [Gammaproteobacteria bacterium]|nr:ribosome silencing factor [Gammaproteobacteria bacterium]